MTDLAEAVAGVTGALAVWALVAWVCARADWPRRIRQLPRRSDR